MKNPTSMAQRPALIGVARMAIAALMSGLVAVIASDAFGRLVWATLMPVPIVALTAFVVRHLRPWQRIMGITAAVAGGAGVAGLIEGAAFRSLGGALIDGPRKLLSTEWPSPVAAPVVVAVAVLVAVVTGCSVDLAGRSRLHVAPLIAIAAGVAAAMAIGAPVRPSWWVLLMLAVGSLALLVLRHGASARGRLVTVFSDRTIPITLGVVIATPLLVSGAVAWVNRADPRRAPDASTTATLLDPVEEFESLAGLERPIDLFRIVDRSTLIGPSLPSRWRIAAMVDYDGQRWTPTVVLRPIGSRLGQPRPPGGDITPPVELELELLTDDFEFVPMPGRPLEVTTGSLDVETDLARSVIHLATTPSDGSALELTAEVMPVAAQVRERIVATRQVDEIAERFVDTARAIGGDGTVFERLRRIESTMRERWELDEQQVGGHQQALIDIFVNESNRGTSGQFVTAFVLLARSLGVDARVATGFIVPPAELAAPLTLRSSHAAVWPEVRMDDVGWVAFDPVPARPSEGDPEPAEGPSAQSPVGAQPPDNQPSDPVADEPVELADDTSAVRGWSSVRRFLTRTGLVTASIVVPVGAVIAAILGTKWRRRKRRLGALDPARRIAGAWANATDSLVDAGLDIQRAWTDDRIAEHGSTLAPSAPHELRRLAASATAITFGHRDRAGQLESDAVATSRSIDAAIGAAMTRWQRLRWRLSVRSLRHPTRSPVTG